MEQKNEIDLKDLFFVFKKYIKLILIVTAATALAFFLFSKLCITPQYQAQATLIVNASSDSTKSTTYDDVTMSQKLVDTYAIILKSSTILNQVIQDLDLNMSAKDLAAQVSVESVGTTEVMNLTVKNSSPDRAKAIASEIIVLAPAEIIRTVKAGSVEIISPAEADPEKVSPNVSVITMVGLLIGLAGSCITVFLIELLNDNIKSSEDVQNKLGYSVIGVIPIVSSTGGQGGLRNG